MSQNCREPARKRLAELRGYADQISLQQVANLSAFGRQARTHSEAQVGAMAASMDEFGFLVPIIIDQDRRVLAGMGRLRAAKRLGLEEVPCIQLSHLTPELKRTFVIAENRLADLAGWDRDILGLELKELNGLELDFQLEVTGFKTIEIDRLIRPVFEDEEDEPPAPPAHITSRVGDLYQLSDHRIFCGDARSGRSFRALMMGEAARACVSDFPFNVDTRTLVTTKLRLRQFPMASGEMSDEEFVEFIKETLGHIIAHVVNGGLIYVVMDWRHQWHVLTAARAHSLEQVNLCVWDKGRGGMGSFYRSQHELFHVFKSGDAPFLNRVELGRHGADRTNVWAYPGATGAKPKHGEEPVPHATPKNVAMLCDALKDCTERGDIVLDAFGGGGSLLMAAERTCRRARMMELDPLYVDVMIERWQRFTGSAAILMATGQTFAELVQARGTAPPVRIRHRTIEPPLAPEVLVRTRSTPSTAPSLRVRHRTVTLAWRADR